MISEVCSTSKVGGKLAITEPSSWQMRAKVSPIRREVCLCKCQQFVVISGVDYRVAKNHKTGYYALTMRYPHSATPEWQCQKQHYACWFHFKWVSIMIVEDVVEERVWEICVGDKEMMR
jgi:hypothetical protein